MKTLFVMLSIVVLSLSGLISPQSRMAPADLVFINGSVYTANDRQPTAEAIAIRGDRFVFVGSNDGARKFVGKNTRVVDLQGKPAFPV